MFGRTLRFLNANRFTPSPNTSASASFGGVKTPSASVSTSSAPSTSFSPNTRSAFECGTSKTQPNNNTAADGGVATASSSSTQPSPSPSSTSTRIGVVVKWLPFKGFGFIVDEETDPNHQRPNGAKRWPPQYFVHQKELYFPADTLPSCRGLHTSARVEFTAKGEGPDNLSAVDVRSVGGDYLPPYTTPPNSDPNRHKPHPTGRRPAKFVWNR